MYAAKKDNLSSRSNEHLSAGPPDLFDTEALSDLIILQNTSEVYEPVADKLAVKHKSVPYGPHPLPYIYVYHRSTNTRNY